MTGYGHGFWFLSVLCPRASRNSFHTHWVPPMRPLLPPEPADRHTGREPPSPWGNTQPLWSEPDHSMIGFLRQCQANSTLILYWHWISLLSWPTERVLLISCHSLFFLRLQILWRFLKKLMGQEEDMTHGNAATVVSAWARKQASPQQGCERPCPAQSQPGRVDFQFFSFCPSSGIHSEQMYNILKGN